MFTVTASAADPLPSEICWMPRGEHKLNAKTIGGGGFAGRVVCDQAGANRVIASFDELKRSGQRMILDLDHSDSSAAADVESMYWHPAKGIMARVTWRPLGATALLNREFTSFSPAFMANEFTGEIAGLIPGHSMGGLVNFPAFQNAMPRLIAARWCDPSETFYQNDDDAGDELRRQIQRNQLHIVSSNE